MERYWNIRYWLARFWQSDYWRGHGGMAPPPPNLTDVAHLVILDSFPQAITLPRIKQDLTLDAFPKSIILEIDRDE